MRELKGRGRARKVKTLPPLVVNQLKDGKVVRQITVPDPRERLVRDYNATYRKLGLTAEVA